MKLIQLALAASLPQITERRNTSLHENFHLPLLCVTFPLDKIRRLLVIECEAFGSNSNLLRVSKYLAVLAMKEIWSSFSSAIEAGKLCLSEKG